ncbi:conserved hypothetical protein [Trichinella spiralis]|uniref:hypothetical protein n=1 Tax=Trichinella spiralis TaxID=6334 RepID=UPI0001EFB7DF|nr:conserved hypothetical protein [Trichinella spiralis]
MKLLTVKNSIAIARYSIQVICEFMKSLSTASIKHLFSCFSRERKQAIIKIVKFVRCIEMNNSISLNLCYCAGLIPNRLLLPWKLFYDQMIIILKCTLVVLIIQHTFLIC